MESTLSAPLAVAAIRKKRQDIGSQIPDGNDLSTWLERVKRQRKRKTQCTVPTIHRHVISPSNASSDVSSQAWSTDSSRLGPRSSTYTTNTTRTSLEDDRLNGKDSIQIAVTSPCRGENSTSVSPPAIAVLGAQSMPVQGSRVRKPGNVIEEETHIIGNNKTPFIDVQRQLSMMERIQQCTTATYERMKADPSGSFTQDEQRKLQNLSVFLFQHSVALFRGRRLPEIVLSLVRLQDTDDPSTASRPSDPPLICIKGLASDKEIADIHLVLSTRPVKSQYSPLRLCYDRSLISYTSFQVIDGDHQLHRLYDSIAGTTSGGVLVCTQGANTWISTVGGLIEMGGQYFLLAGSSHTATRPPRMLEQKVSFFDTIAEDDLDDDIHPPIVLDMKPTAVHPRNDNNTMIRQLTQTAKVGSGTESRLSCEEGDSWYLVAAAEESGVCLPNFIRVPADMQSPFGSPFGYIRHYRTDLEGCPVLINSGMSGVLSGTLFECPSYLFSGKTMTQVQTIELQSGTKLQQGDSGSWVLDHRFQVMGSIIAVSADGCAYMIPIKTQLDEMQRSNQTGSTRGEPSIADPLMLMLRLSHFHFRGKNELRSKFYAEQAIDIARAISSEQSHLNPTSAPALLAGAVKTKAEILGMSMSFFWNSLRTTSERSEFIRLLASTGTRIQDVLETTPSHMTSSDGSGQRDTDTITQPGNLNGAMMQELANIYNSNPMLGPGHGTQGTVHGAENPNLNNRVIQAIDNDNEQDCPGDADLSESHITQRLLNLAQWVFRFLLGVITTQSLKGGLQKARYLLFIVVGGAVRMIFGFGGTVCAAFYISRGSSENISPTILPKFDMRPSAQIISGIVVYVSWLLAMILASIGYTAFYYILRTFGKIASEFLTLPKPPQRKVSPSETATMTTDTQHPHITTLSEETTASPGEPKKGLARLLQLPRLWHFVYAFLMQPLAIGLVVPWLVLKIFYAIRWREEGDFTTQHDAWWSLVWKSGGILLADSLLVRILFFMSKSLGNSATQRTKSRQQPGGGVHLLNRIRLWRLPRRRSRTVRERVNELIVIGVTIAALRCMFLRF